MTYSDSSSSSSKSVSGSITHQQTDEGLHDHRNQQETLPRPESLSIPPTTHRVRRDSSVSPTYCEETRSYSFCEAIEDSALYTRRNSRINRVDLPRIMKTSSNISMGSANLNPSAHPFRGERRPSRVSIDPEVDSHASRSSQDTEEDVCFPVLKEPVRTNGIDFDEIENFIKEERESKLCVREKDVPPFPSVVHGDYYTREGSPFNGNGNNSSSQPKNENAHFDEKRNFAHSITNGSDDFEATENEIQAPSRFSFFHSDNEETVHSPDISSLVPSDRNAKELFKNGEGTWWLDCTCPTDFEMKTLAKAFGIHPLTAEDIRMQEPREKVELFKNYYFVCFHTFESDQESEDYLQPIYVYIVVFREGVITFQFSPVSHPANVRRRVRQLREYVDVSADWIGYAIIDDITDAFAPVLNGVEYEADAIEESVFDALEVNFSSMLRKIGESRRKVMTLMRLLSNKADVIRMFAKRCQDEAWAMPPDIGISPGGLGPTDPREPSAKFDSSPGVSSNTVPQYSERVQPRADIALYLGDIQDHVVTMFQNLSAYEKIFSRSHANYLAQLQVKSFNANLTVTRILGNVTMIGTMFLPLNVITGLFGMNVKVLGEGEPGWFWGILGLLVLIVLVSFVGVKYWLRRIEAKERDEESSRRSVKNFSLRNKRREAPKSILSYSNRYD